jgi:hypothetical protein
MKTKHRILSAVLFAAVAAAPLTYSTTAAAEQVAAAPAKANYYTKLVDIDFVKKYAVIPVRDDVMISLRLAAQMISATFACQHPDTQFDELAGSATRTTEVADFLLQGQDCGLPQRRLRKLGYNIVGLSDDKQHGRRQPGLREEAARRQGADNAD